jgi:prepilin-type N-terminal cleavage/methylation domain-containing protein
MNHVRSESGFTLIELLIAATLMTIVIGATLNGLDVFQNTTRDNGLRNEAQQTARVAMDRLARELRNGATSSAQAQQGLELAGPYDLVFQTVDATMPASSLNVANIRRSRYCLDARDPANGRLVLQTQRWTSAAPPAVPSTASCPDTAWGPASEIADHLVNRRDGQNRPVFAYNSATLNQITRLRVQLYVDARRDSADNGTTRETTLASGVVLRNQNRPPTASFSADRRSGGQIALNASASSDPDGDPLTYEWFDGSTRLPATTVTYEYTPSSSSSRPIRLVVYDPAGLSATVQKVVP